MFQLHGVAHEALQAYARFLRLQRVRARLRRRRTPKPTLGEFALAAERAVAQHIHREGVAAILAEHRETLLTRLERATSLQELHALIAGLRVPR